MCFYSRETAFQRLACFFCFFTSTSSFLALKLVCKDLYIQENVTLCCRLFITKTKISTCVCVYSYYHPQGRFTKKKRDKSVHMATGTLANSKYAICQHLQEQRKLVLLDKVAKYLWISNRLSSVLSQNAMLAPVEANTTFRKMWQNICSQQTDEQQLS